MILSALTLILQLSLTQSDISHIGSMKVEGIVHPTTAEIDLKEEIGEAVLRADKAVLKLAFWIVVLYDHLRNDFRKVLGFVCYEEWDYYSSQGKCPYWFFLNQ